MLRSFTIENGSLDAKVELCSGPLSRFGTWITVLIGQNGSRKSFFLREILYAALDAHDKSVGAARKSIMATYGWEASLPRALVCISGTPLDRFPRTRNLTLGIQKRKAEVRFLYLGQRASNGVAGTTQSERALMTALFVNADHTGARRHLFKEVFLAIGFKPRIEISLTLGKELARHRRNWHAAAGQYGSMAKDPIEDHAKKVIEQYCESVPIENHSPRLRRVLERVRHFDFMINGIFKLLGWFATPESAPKLIFENGVIRLCTPSWEGWGVDELEIFIRAGLVDVDRTTFFKFAAGSGPEKDDANDVQLAGDDISSGQWAWIAGFCGLAAHIDNNGLVLIDEPENSLHPLWQQKYIPMLNSILREYEGAQAIIVTHSPVIASGVDPDCGQVEALQDQGVNADGRQVIRSSTVANTYGWKFSDVYEEAFSVPSSRAPSFIRTADIALAQIRGGEPVGDVEHELLQQELSRNLASLPFTDPLRHVLHSILKELQARVKDKG